MKQPLSTLGRFYQYIKERDRSSVNIVPIPDDPDLEEAEPNVEVDEKKTGSSELAGPASTSGSSSSKSVSSAPGPLNKSLVSPAQREWMLEELEQLGLLPQKEGYNQQGRWKGKSLFVIPPPGELQSVPFGTLPRPEPYWLHPFFIWFPTKMLVHLTPRRRFTCFMNDTTGCQGQMLFQGIGNARSVVGSGTYATGIPNMAQYYIISSIIKCNQCDATVQSSDDRFMKSLPNFLKDLYPAHISYRKLVCKSLVDVVRRGGRPLEEIAGEINKFSNGRYELLHKQYLAHAQTMRHQMETVKVVKCSKKDKEAPLRPFGEFSEERGYRGVNISREFLTQLMIHEYEIQKPYLIALQKGVYGSFYRCDHTRSVAKKVELKTGAMWSYAIMNEHMQIVSYVLTGGDGEAHLVKCWAGLKKRYEKAKAPLAQFRWVDKNCCTAPPYSTNEKGKCGLVQGQMGKDRDQFRRNSAARQYYNPQMEELLDGYHTLSRIGKACTSECHSGYAAFMEGLSDAVYQVDKDDLSNLEKAWAFATQGTGRSGGPTKRAIRRHCKTHIPSPEVVIENIELLMANYANCKDSDGLPLFSAQMETTWDLQRTHISRGCLSDPNGVVLYNQVKFEQLFGNKNPKAKVPVYVGVRSSSQLEGFHFHQNRFVTGTVVTGEFWQAQVAFEVCEWNKKRAVEYLHHDYPQNSNPRLLFHLNHYYHKEFKQYRYPKLVMNWDETGETFGFEYLLNSHIDDMTDALLDETEEEYVPLVVEKASSLRLKKSRSSSVVEEDNDVDVALSGESRAFARPAPPLTPSKSPTRSKSPALPITPSTFPDGNVGPC